MRANLCTLLSKKSFHPYILPLISGVKNSHWQNACIFLGQKTHPRIEKNLSIYSVISLSLFVLRRPTLVQFCWFMLWGGGVRGFCGFFFFFIIYLVRGTTWLVFGAAARQKGLCDNDVTCRLPNDITSGLPDDVTIDGDLGHGSQTDGQFQVTSDVMGCDVTSGRSCTKDVL